jgi:hypothetical protein
LSAPGFEDIPVPIPVQGYEIHVAISSSFTKDEIIKPTEPFLRKFFMRYGAILDLHTVAYSMDEVSICLSFSAHSLI